jgi:hypothetical protein
LIAIHLDRGNYFSLNAAAGLILELAAQRPTIGEIVEVLVGRYDGGRPEIEAEIVRFMGELQAEGLIGTSSSREAGFHPAPATSDKEPFVAPLLAVHRDMQDLFLLDPVHEVGEAGWPEKQSQSAGTGQ